MYKITIDKHKFEIEADALEKLDIIHSNRGVHVIDGHLSQEIKLISCDLDNKTVVIDIEGKEYKASISDQYDQLVDQLGFTTESTVIIKEIKAPMPGLVLDLLVGQGQAVEKGTQLVILEAMKMENVLKSQTEGVVKDIIVKKGDAVDKGQLLIVLE